MGDKTTKIKILIKNIIIFNMLAFFKTLFNSAPINIQIIIVTKCEFS